MSDRSTEVQGKNAILDSKAANAVANEVDQYNLDLLKLNAEYAGLDLQAGCVLLRMYRRATKTSSGIALPISGRGYAARKSGYGQEEIDDAYPFELKGVVVAMDNSLENLRFKVGDLVQVSPDTVMSYPIPGTSEIRPRTLFYLWKHATTYNKVGDGYGYILVYPRDILVNLSNSTINNK